MTDFALQVSNLATSYGDLKVVQDVSFAVRPGQAIAILGRNGAGKTTTLRAISGLNVVNAGDVLFEGESIAKLSAHRRALRGLAYVQEGKRIFTQLTVEENLVLGGVASKLRGAALKSRIDEAYARFPVLKDKASNRAASLSGGQQQMLAIAQALIPGPRVLLLDEPSGGLAPVIVGEVLSTIKDLVGEGLTVVLVEQAVGFALALCDSIVVLDQGQVGFTGNATDPGIESSLEKAYFSRS